MDKIIPQLYREYGLYVNKHRSFPLDIDGLKPVERRVLLSAYQIARDKFVKSARIDGTTVGHYHPHGSCLDGSTEITLLNGSTKKIEDLVDESEFWVYSCKPDGTIVPGLAHSVRVTKTVKSLIEITLDNNEKVRCTEDHLIMIRDGNFKEAKDLVPGESLMPLYLRYEDGYKFYLDNSGRIPGGEKVCWMVARNLLNENFDEMKTNGYHTHHKNSIRSDDRPENISLLSKSEHARLTCSELSVETRKDIERKKRIKYQNDRIYREKLLDGLRKGRERMFSNVSPIRDRIRRKNSKLMSDYNSIQVKDRILKIIKILLNEQKEVNLENYEDIRKKFYNYPLWHRVTEHFNSVEEAISVAGENHVIISIERIDLTEPIRVYDMTVNEHHNFAIGQGIFVHNCYGTTVQMVRQGFLEGQGNFGCDLGVDPSPPAAMRYTECRLSKHILELAFELINYVPWEEVELDKEPLFLPTMFPLCLLGREYTLGIGFGYRTLIPCYSIQDLHKRLLWKLGVRKRKPIIRPLTDCEILSTDKELDELLTTGKLTMKLRGVLEVDNKACQATVRSWPPGQRFETVLRKVSKSLDNQDIGFADLSSEKNGTSIVFEVLKQRNRDAIFKNFVPVLEQALEGNISFEVNVVNSEQQVETKSIDDLIVNTFNFYTNTNGLMLASEIERMNKVIEEFNHLEQIKPSVSKYLKKKVTDIKKITKLISSDSGVNYEIVKALMTKYNIRRLFTIKTETDELWAKIKELGANLENLKEYSLSRYEGVV